MHDLDAVPTPTARLEGLSLPVSDVRRLAEFDQGLGFAVEQSAGANFAWLRLGGGTLGPPRAALPETCSAGLRVSVHIELTTDDLDGLNQHPLNRGVSVGEAPTDHPWERPTVLLDSDGDQVAFAPGRRGKNASGAAQGGIS